MKAWEGVYSRVWSVEAERKRSAEGRGKDFHGGPGTPKGKLTAARESNLLRGNRSAPHGGFWPPI